VAGGAGLLLFIAEMERYTAFLQDRADPQSPETRYRPILQATLGHQLDPRIVFGLVMLGIVVALIGLGYGGRPWLSRDTRAEEPGMQRPRS
jgi:hypothetical protein